MKPGQFSRASILGAIWAFGPSALAASTSELSATLPPHVRHQPKIGFQIAYRPEGLGAANLLKNLGATLGTQQVRAWAFSLEYQPELPSQSYGVFGIGATAALYPITPQGYFMPVASLNPLGSIHSFGAVARYQFRYFSRQWIVPTLAYQFDRLHYSVHSSATGNFEGSQWLNGPALSAMIFLNALDSSSADSFVDLGLARTYLVAEWRLIRSPSKAGVPGSEDSTLGLGLRMEF